MYPNNFFLNIIVNNLTLVSLDSVDENRGPAASEEKVAALEKYIPTRTYHLTFLKPCVWIQANSLPAYDVSKKWTSLHSKAKKVRLVL